MAVNILSHHYPRLMTKSTVQSLQADSATPAKRETLEQRENILIQKHDAKADELIPLILGICRSSREGQEVG